jgi:enoyl-[acyl-carrier protein] reductase II
MVAANVDGDLTAGLQFVGQSQGLVRDIVTVEALVSRVVQQAAAAHQRIGRDHLE